MALVFMEGFDHYGTDTNNMVLGEWVSVGGSLALNTASPRTGTHSLTTTSSSPGYLELGVPGLSRTSLGFGMAINFGEVPGSTFSFLRFINDENDIQMNLAVTNAGAIISNIGSNTSGPGLGQTANGVISFNSYNHVECFTTIDNAVGVVQIRVNGVEVLNVTGVDTAANPPNYVTNLELRTLGSVGNPGYIDDVFVWDTTGTTNNDFLGQRHVVTMLPNANEVTQEWTNGDFTAIDDLEQDGDTTYITASDSTPVTSEFGFGDIPAGYADVAGVQLKSLIRKDTVGGASFQQSIISSASVDDGQDRGVTDGYTYHTDVFDQNPATATDWTVPTVNAATARVRRTS